MSACATVKEVDDVTHQRRAQEGDDVTHQRRAQEVALPPALLAAPHCRPGLRTRRLMRLEEVTRRMKRLH